MKNETPAKCPGILKSGSNVSSSMISIINLYIYKTNHFRYHSNQEDNQENVREEGVIETVLNILRKHIDNTTVCLIGCFTLSSMIKKNSK